jgi:PAS domain S-box-containing protein
MVAPFYFSILWAGLITLDLLIATRLFSLYQNDHDVRKLMFTIGLLMCTPIYVLAIVGIDSSPLARSIFDWSPLPVLLAFLFTLLNDRFKLDLKNCFRLFTVGTSLTFVLFFAPLQNASLPVLGVGVIFAILLSLLQYSRKFDLASVTLFLSMPTFTVCFVAIGLNMTELALFAGFTAKAALLLAFEISKRIVGDSSSILVLKKKLGVAEENFSKLFSMLPDPAVIVDGKGTFLALTSSVTTITGFQKEELLGTNFVTTDLISAHSKAVLVKNLAKRMLGFHIAPYEIELRAKDGRNLQFELNALKIEYEGNSADMVIFRDLNERNKLLKSLKEQQERFQNIAKSTGDWVWEVDSEGKYVYSNPVVEKILGYTAEEIIGRKFCDLLSSIDTSQMGDFFDAFASKSCQFGKVKRCLHKDGHVSIMETRGVPVYGVDGKVVGYRGVDRDVTEKKGMEARLLKSDRFAAIGELATMVAHDLRNPLQGIAAAVHYVRRATQQIENEKMAAALQGIEDSVKYSDKIIRDLLDFSTNIRLEIEETDPHSIVSQALSGIVVPEKVEVIDRSQNKPKVYVDLGRIRRVIVNLVANAFEAMPDGGTLTIVSRQKDGNLELSLTDTGAGIPKEKMQRLWTPFVTTKAKGIGLGLPISKRIVEAHGGQISVYSKNGKGTAFTLVLPIVHSEKNSVEFLVDDRSSSEEPLRDFAVFE